VGRRFLDVLDDDHDASLPVVFSIPARPEGGVHFHDQRAVIGAWDIHAHHLKPMTLAAARIRGHAFFRVIFDPGWRCRRGAGWANSPNGLTFHRSGTCRL
jgi:hypothetical protein